MDKPGMREVLRRRQGRQERLRRGGHSCAGQSTKDMDKASWVACRPASAPSSRAAARPRCNETQRFRSAPDPGASRDRAAAAAPGAGAGRSRPRPPGSRCIPRITWPMRSARRARAHCARLSALAPRGRAVARLGRRASIARTSRDCGASCSGSSPHWCPIICPGASQRRPLPARPAAAAVHRRGAARRVPQRRRRCRRALGRKILVENPSTYLQFSASAIPRSGISRRRGARAPAAACCSMSTTSTSAPATSSSSRPRCCTQWCRALDARSVGRDSPCRPCAGHDDGDGATSCASTITAITCARRCGRCMSRRSRTSARARR